MSHKQKEKDKLYELRFLFRFVVVHGDAFSRYKNTRNTHDIDYNAVK